MNWNQLFARKNLDHLLLEMKGDERLKRVLGPINLTSLGVGAVIGAGIFVATGKAASQCAGPALMVSYIVAGVTCIFAALCYAEFASMAPVAGSAYTYAYITMGELDHWLGLDPGICRGSGHGGEWMVGILSEITVKVRAARSGSV
jgi:APA family basic amino acid/polyamine antiporter